MRAQIIQQRRVEADGCNFFGLQFSEKFIRRIDAGLFLCLLYRVILEASDYAKYQEDGKCTKPFGLFWIGFFVSMIMFRFFHYQKKCAEYHYYRLLEREAPFLLRRARFWVNIVRGFKVLAYFGVLGFTILGSVWFVLEGSCLNSLDENSNEYAEFKMAFWLLVSFAMCLTYARMVYTRWRSTGAPRDVLQVVDNIPISRVMTGRTLTEIELNAIKKSRLINYDELSRFAKETPRHTQQMPIKLNTFSNNEIIPEKNDSIEVIDEPELKQDESEPSQGVCAVCLEDIKIGEWYKRLPQCEHCFHATCIDQWLVTRATCPVCRGEIFIDVRALERSVADRHNPSAGANSGSNSRSSYVVRFSRALS